jgi:prepilin-type N-terminal cleavage/methylation domain-containing protein
MGKTNSAFTLVEVMIVVSVLVILAVITLLFLRGQIFKGNDARRKADLSRIRVAIEEYEKDHNCYPPPELLRCNPGTGLQPYLDKIPCDPVTKIDYVYEYDTSNVCSDWYRLFANMQSNDLSGSGYFNPNGTGVYCVTSPNAKACKYEDRGNYYACKSGVCIPIMYDKSVGGWECANKFPSSNCNGQCPNPRNECRPTQR